MGLDGSSHVQRLSWCSLQESLDGVRLGGGDCGGTDQGGVEGVWWNFLAILTLATCPVVTFRAITSSAPLVPSVAELGAKVKLPLHIPVAYEAVASLAGTIGSESNLDMASLLSYHVSTSVPMLPHQLNNLSSFSLLTLLALLLRQHNLILY